jgi:hypothetical protein
MVGFDAFFCSAFAWFRSGAYRAQVEGARARFHHARLIWCEADAFTQMFMAVGVGSASVRARPNETGSARIFGCS